MPVSRAWLGAWLLSGVLATVAASAWAGPREARAAFVHALQADFRQGEAETPAQIVDGYGRACDGGEDLACRHRAWHRPAGAHLASALLVFAPACDADDTLACLVVGWSLGLTEPDYAYGAGAVDPAGALGFLDQACRAGVSGGCKAHVALSRILQPPAAPDREPPRPVPDAAPPASDQAKRSFSGDNPAPPAATPPSTAPPEAATPPLAPSPGGSPPVARDLAPAGLHRACTEANDRPSCTALGRAYFSGGGVPRSLTRAAAWFAFACEGNDAEGCHLLARMRRSGLGGPRDRSAGMALDAKACEAGFAAACDALKRDPAASAEADVAIRREAAGAGGYGVTLGVSYALAPVLAVPTLGLVLLAPPFVHGANGHWGRFGRAMGGVAGSTLGGGLVGAMVGAGGCASQSDDCALVGFFVGGSLGYLGWAIYDTSQNTGPAAALRGVRVVALPTDGGLRLAVGGGF